MKNNVGILAGIAIGSFIAGGIVVHVGANWRSTATTDNDEKPKKNEEVEEKKDGSNIEDTGGDIQGEENEEQQQQQQMEKPHPEELPVDFDQYVLEHSLREPSILRELREYTLKHVQAPESMTKPIEAQFFRLILNMIDARYCIEIGAFTGYNLLSCALSVPDNGTVYALEVNKEYLEHAHQFFEKAKVTHKIQTKIGVALESLDKLIQEKHNESIDFIYIDADHLNFANYLERSLVLLRVGGIVAISNTLLGATSGQSNTSSEAMHKLNLAIKLDNRFQLSVLNIGDGITICRKI